MSSGADVIALISATPTAIPPAEAAFAEDYHTAGLWHLLDDHLLSAAAEAGGVSEPLAERMRRLIRHALTEGADAVLLTCSMYGAVAADFTGPTPVLAPDQAAFDDIRASGARRLLVVASLASALADTTQRLQDYLAEAGVDMEIVPVAVPAAFDAAGRGDTDGMTAAIIDACADLADDVDAIFLAQYSLAPARTQLGEATGRRVIAGPSSAAKMLRARLSGNRGGSASTPRAARPLGVIADDFTGAMDVASALAESGQSTLVFFGVPANADDLPDHDAIVIGEKIRSVPEDVAADAATAAAQWLLATGAAQLYYKYCSTFDSTPRGNIGPVLDALADVLDATGEAVPAAGPRPLIVTTPSSPQHGRTVYGGQLFVYDTPLAETHMAHHPITPMTDSSLVRILTPQTSHPIGTVPWEVVTAGGAALEEALDDLRGEGNRYAIVDALTDDDLRGIAHAAADEPLLAGAAGLAGALGAMRSATQRNSTPPAVGTGSDRAPVQVRRGDRHRTVILAGSCSARTLEQIDHFRAAGGASYQVEADGSDSNELAAAALRWFDGLPDDVPALVYSSLPPDQLRAVQKRLGEATASHLFESALGAIATGLTERGVRRFVIAGGETSGAVLQDLEVRSGRIGEAVAPGVPWLHTFSATPLALLLKSGNFGEPDLFTRIATERSGDDAADGAKDQS